MLSNISYALKFMGLHEKKDRQKLMQMFKFAGFQLDPSTTPWCAAFVNYIQKLQHKPGTGKLNARSFLKYGTPVKMPKGGDIVVLSRGNKSWQGHVGFFVEYASKDEIRVLGGNQGDCVCIRNYPVHRVLGYRNTDKV